MTYIVDANVLFSCLIGGNNRVLSLLETYAVFTPDFAFAEIQEHQQTILQKTRLTPNLLKTFSNRLFKLVVTVPNMLISTQSYYQAFALCKDIDPKDTAYVALAIEFDHPLLTRDRVLATGLRARGFTQVLLLDELLA
jgi:predicted nucleic acid-binding protein